MFYSTLAVDFLSIYLNNRMFCLVLSYFILTTVRRIILIMENTFRRH